MDTGMFRERACERSHWTCVCHARGAAPLGSSTGKLMSMTIHMLFNCNYFNSILIQFIADSQHVLSNKLNWMSPVIVRRCKHPVIMRPCKHPVIQMNGKVNFVYSFFRWDFRLNWFNTKTRKLAQIQQHSYNYFASIRHCCILLREGYRRQI